MSKRRADGRSAGVAYREFVGADHQLMYQPEAQAAILRWLAALDAEASP